MDMALGMCRRPLKRFQQPKQSDKGPRWVKDKAVFWCKHCNTDFSVVVRKHHCRHCGHIFCSHCCNNKRTLIKFGYLKPVRLCNKCNANCFKADLLLNAVGLNDLNTVKKICEEGCDVHFTTTIFPALTIAANRGSSDMVRMLLRYGADVNHAVPATDSGTVVQCSRCGRTQAAGTIKDNQYECTYCGNFTRHADASDSDHTGITALHAAVQKEGHLDVVVALLEHGAIVDTMTAKGNTPLMYASAGGHCECAGVLLEYGAQPSVTSDADLDTPLHKCVREGHIEVVRLLLQHKADLSCQNIAGLSPQKLAERCKRNDIAKLLGGAAAGEIEFEAPPDKISGSAVEAAAPAKENFGEEEMMTTGPPPPQVVNLRLTEEERILQVDAGGGVGGGYGAGPVDDVDDDAGEEERRGDGDEEEEEAELGGGAVGAERSMGLLESLSRDMEEEEVRHAEDLVSRLEMEEEEELKKELSGDVGAEEEEEEEEAAGGAVEGGGGEDGGEGKEEGGGGGEVEGKAEGEVGAPELEGEPEEADEGLVVRKGKKKGGKKKR